MKNIFKYFIVLALLFAAETLTVSVPNETIGTSTVGIFIGFLEKAEARSCSAASQSSVGCLVITVCCLTGTGDSVVECRSDIYGACR